MIRILCFAVLITALACGPGQPPTFPQAPVVLITVDTLRADRTSVYGYDIQTPAYAQLAAESIVFNRAFSQAPQTLPSHAGIFTSQLPNRHGVRENLGFKLDDSAETLAERFRDAGYRTGGFVSSMVLRRSTGISQGFDTYDDEIGLGASGAVRTYAQRPGGETIDAALRWLDQDDTRPPLLWLHIYEPHSPWDSPAEYRDPTRHPYEGDVRHSDALIGRFIDGLKERGVYDDAIIMFFSDHGEGLGDHGELEHGLFTYREAVHVPFFIRLPGARNAGERHPETVGLIDLAPTLLALLDLPALDGDGRNLLPKPPAGRDIYSEAMSGKLNYGWHAYRSVFRDSLHYQEGYESELFDLETDFAERNNLFGTRKIPDSSTTMMDTMTEEVASGSETISDADKALLESLGYTGGFDFGGAAKDLPPAEFLKIHQNITQASRLINQGDHAQAETLLTAMLTQFPTMNSARAMLGQAMIMQEKLDTAEHLLMEGLAQTPNHQGMLVALTGVKAKLGKSAEAVTLAERAMSDDPLLSGRKLAMIFMEAEDFDNARTFATRMAEFDPQFALAHILLADFAAEPEADPNRARQLLLAGLNRHATGMQAGTVAEALYYLGDNLGKMGRYDAAEPVFIAGIQQRPDKADLRVALSKLYASMRRANDAIQVMDSWVRDFPSRTNYLQAADTMALIGIDKAADFYRNEAANYQDTP